MKDISILQDFLSESLSVGEKSTVESFLQSGKVIHCLKNDFVWRPEERAKQVVFLMDGKAREYAIDEDGHDNTFRFAYKPGDVLINDNRHLEGAVFYWEALSKSTFLSVPSIFVDQAFERDEGFRNNILERMKEHHAQDARLRYALMTKYSKEKYLWFLEEFSDFPKGVPQKYIATYLNMLPQTLSEIKHDIKVEKGD